MFTHPMTRLLQKNSGKRPKISSEEACKYFGLLREEEDAFYARVGLIEKQMQEETGIEELEFVWSDGCVVGIGTPSNPRSMRLVHR